MYYFCGCEILCLAQVQAQNILHKNLKGLARNRVCVCVYVYICLPRFILHGLTGLPTIKQRSRFFSFFSDISDCFSSVGKKTNKSALFTQSCYSELNYSIFPCQGWVHFINSWGDFYFKGGVEIAVDGRYDLNVRWYPSGNSNWRCFSDHQSCWEMRWRSVSERKSLV